MLYRQFQRKLLESQIRWQDRTEGVLAACPQMLLDRAIGLRPLGVVLSTCSMEEKD